MKGKSQTMMDNSLLFCCYHKSLGGESKVLKYDIIVDHIVLMYGLLLHPYLSVIQTAEIIEYFFKEKIIGVEAFECLRNKRERKKCFTVVPVSFLT